jgi:hypothetical protein
MESMDWALHGAKTQLRRLKVDSVQALLAGTVVISCAKL